MDKQPLRVKTVFNQALELATAAERAAYLEQACAGAPALREKVEALLRAYEEAGSFLERPAEAPGHTEPFTPTPADTATVSDEQPGAVMGPYKLVQQLGEGGMGTVWMAQQTAPVKRLVALKVIKSGMDSRQVITRFEAERQALALMDHPNIARVFDAGTTDNGRPYFVMELVKGVPLTQYCDDHRLTPRQRLELFIPVCEAIQHAHQKGIIHRDIKPSNVLVALYDGKPVPKVIDFGIAKATGQSLTEHTLVTGFGTVIGTLEYMSPEQAELNQLDIDTRSDIYSLGVLLYELLTGTTPLEKKRLAESAILELLRLIREEEPPRPSMRLSESKDSLPSISAQRQTEPAKLTKLVRGDLDWIAMKALDKDRNRRYESASSFALDILRYLADEPVQACPPSAWYRFGKFARRNKVRLAVVAGVLLAVTGIAAGIGWAMRDRAAREAEIERTESARRAQAENRAHDSWKSARILIAENKLTAARQKLAEARSQLGSDWSALGALAAEVEADERELVRFQQFLELVDRAQQAETAPQLEAPLDTGASQSRGKPLRARLTPGTAAAIQFHLEALRCYQVLERDDWNTNLTNGLLGRVQRELIRRLVYEELLWLAEDVTRQQQDHQSRRNLSPKAAARQALVYLGKAESAHRASQALYSMRARCRRDVGEEAAAQSDQQLADTTRPTLAMDRYLYALNAAQAKQLTEAVKALEEALRLDPTHYWSLMKMGLCWLDLGQGREDFARAVVVFTGCILKRPDHAYAHYCRAGAYRKLGRYPEAVADCSRAIDLDPGFAEAWYLRGRICGERGQLKEAIADFSQAIALDSKLAIAWLSRGVGYSRLGQQKKAVADCSRAIELDSQLAIAWYTRGVAYSYLDETDKAVADCSRAIALDQKDADAWISRGAVYLTVGLPDKALADFSQAIALDRRNPAAWHNRAVVYTRLRQPEKAAADLSQLIDLAPAPPLLVKGYRLRQQANLWLGRYEQALADAEMALKLAPDQIWAHNTLAWLLAVCPEQKLRDPARAVELVQKALQLPGADANCWNTLGVAHYRAEDWKAAVAALDKSVELGGGGGTVDWLFLAMAHQRLSHADEARKWYDRAVVWLDRSGSVLAGDPYWARELSRFRSEAEEVLGLKK
jgi:serine/threonine protein kinase/Tfp pilus assembly protein PilF